MQSILLVDDNKVEREGVRFVLEKENCNLKIFDVDNGFDALTFLKEKEFDLLITDIKMPLMTGTDLIKNVREFNKNIDIVVISGFDDFEYVKSLLSENVSNYILKPVNIIELLDTVHSILKDKNQENEISNNRVIVSILKIIEKEYMHNLNLEILSQRVFLTSNYLSILFKKETGMGFSHYLSYYRLHKAKELVLNSNMKISDISAYIGINNPSYFNRIFKREFNLTPQECRGLSRERVL